MRGFVLPLTHLGRFCHRRKFTRSGHQQHQGKRTLGLRTVFQDLPWYCFGLTSGSCFSSWGDWYCTCKDPALPAQPEVLFSAALLRSRADVAKIRAWAVSEPFIIIRLVFFFCGPLTRAATAHTLLWTRSRNLRDNYRTFVDHALLWTRSRNQEPHANVFALPGCTSPRSSSYSRPGRSEILPWPWQWARPFIPHFPPSPRSSWKGQAGRSAALPWKQKKIIQHHHT